MTCIHDRDEQCLRSCTECSRFARPICAFCEDDSAGEYFMHDGFTICLDCLVDKYDSTFHNLYQEFAEAHPELYREFVAKYFKEERIDG